MSILCTKSKNSSSFTQRQCLYSLTLCALPIIHSLKELTSLSLSPHTVLQQHWSLPGLPGNQTPFHLTPFALAHLRLNSHFLEICSNGRFAMRSCLFSGQLCGQMVVSPPHLPDYCNLPCW